MSLEGSTPRKLILNGPREIVLEPVESIPLRAGEARLQSLCSGLSHGTEMNHYRGQVSSDGTEFDQHMRIFRQVADVSSLFPVGMGYELVSRVVEVAPGTKGIEVGDLVHTDDSHAEETIINVEAAHQSVLYPMVKIPPTLTPDDALYISLGSVALQAVHDARIKVGDAVAVFGLGAVGLLTVQLARMNGASLIVGVDPITERRSLAEQTGASITIDPTDGSDGAGAAVKERVPFADDVPSPPTVVQLPGAGVDIAIETSGTYPALHEAIRSVAVGGRVVAVGYYQGGASAVRFGSEWHVNRLEMIGSMGVWGCPHRDYPRWGRQRMMRTVTDLLASGALDVSPFPMRTFPFDQAAAAYELVDTDPAAAVKVALRYE